MSQDHCHSVQTPGSGTNRVNRLLGALLPDFVAVDERKIEDLKDFAIQLSAELKFKSAIGWSGDWSEFFKKKVETDQRTDPHYALFLAFLENFTLAQKDLNQLNQRHIDFFYRDVLRLKEKPAEADQAYLILELAKQTQEFLLPKNNQFKAGKDNTGAEIAFANPNEEALNKAEVAAIKSLFRDQNNRFYASPVANSADGQGGEITDSEGQWSPFGIPNTLFPESDRKLAILGFAIASPTLLLQEGLRQISLTLLLEPQEGLLERLKTIHLNNSFRFLLSGEKEWIEAIPGFELETSAQIDAAALDFINSAKTWQDIAGIEPQAGPVFDNPEIGNHRPFQGYDIGETTAKNILAKRNTYSNKRFPNLPSVQRVRGMGEDKIADLRYSFRNQKHELKDLGNQGIALILKCHLIPDQDPVIGYSEEVLIQKFKSQQPLIKVELAETTQSYAYPVLQDIQVKSVKINVNVTGVESLVLQNDNSVLPAGKNVHPFGFRPSVGSSFYIGNHEAFSKALKSMSLELDWHGLPENITGFTGHYAGYSSIPSNSSFTVKSAILDDRVFGPTVSSFRLFNENGTLQPTQRYDLSSSLFSTIKAEPELETFEEWKPNVKRGFLKLSLENDFRHKIFSRDFSEAVLKIANPVAGQGTITIPKEPYTPEIKSVKLDYSAEELFDDFGGPWNSFFHIGAFGESKIKEQPIRTLLPSYTAEGSVFIGLKNHLPGQSVQILIHILDGSGNPEKALPDVEWSFLSNNQWIKVNPLDLVLDETNGLIQTGLVKFTLPRAANQSHTLLPDGHTWIKAEVNENSDAIPKFTQILAQAIRVVFEEKDNDPERLAQALPSETISKLKISLPQISKIKQPFASFGGKTQESSEDFYQRVSERLRHKSRAITRWDYEHLVLEKFSSIYQVKVLNHTQYEGNLNEYRALAPRHVTTVLVANVQNKNAVDPLRPKASVALIAAVDSFLSKINSSGVFLHVVNPIYEELQVKTKVKFFAGFDQSIYAKKLEDELKAFLSPWAFEGVDNFEFAGEIHGSVILHFIEKRPYVDFLTCFELYHIIKNPIDGAIISRKKVENAVGSTGVSLLGSIGKVDSYGDHLIEVLETEDCKCEDNEVLPTVEIVSSEDSDMDEAYST